MNDALKVGVNLCVEVRDAESGRLLHTEQGHNLVVAAGRNIIRDALYGSRTGIGLSAISLGTGNTAANANDTALVSQVNTGGISQRSLGTGQIIVQRFIGSQEANGNTLAEVGLWVGSTLFARYVLAATVNKTSAVTLTITWSVAIGTP